MELFEEIDNYLRLHGAIDNAERILDLEDALHATLRPYIHSEEDRRRAWAYIGQRIREAQNSMRNPPRS